MKHIKEYNEFYDGEDLQDLVDTLSEVGLADKFKVECNVFIMVPDKEKHLFDWPEWAFRNIEVEVICPDDKRIILEKAFEKVLLGEFIQEENSYLDQMFKSAPELAETLGKSNIIDLAKGIKENPNKSNLERFGDGSLYSLQFMLVGEIEDLMVNRISGPNDPDQRELRHLNENIGYNVKVTKL
jgi:hypothetical protein